MSCDNEANSAQPKSWPPPPAQGVRLTDLTGPIAAWGRMLYNLMYHTTAKVWNRLSYALVMHFEIGDRKRIDLQIRALNFLRESKSQP